MSRIDTAKLNSASNSGISSARMSRALSRNAAPLPLEGNAPRSGMVATQPFAQDRVVERHDDTMPSLSAVSEADIAAIAGMGAEHLVGELSRITLLLKDARLETDDPDLQHAFDIGASMIGENIRRVRLVHAGQDSLVLKR
jgi:hypothetical protein